MQEINLIVIIGDDFKRVALGIFAYEAIGQSPRPTRCGTGTRSTISVYRERDFHCRSAALDPERPHVSDRYARPALGSASVGLKYLRTALLAYRYQANCTNRDQIKR